MRDIYVLINSRSFFFLTILPMNAASILQIRHAIGSIYTHLSQLPSALESTLFPQERQQCSTYEKVHHLQMNMGLIAF